MVEVISQQQREQVRKNLEIVKSNIREYKKRLQQLQSRRALQMISRVERRKQHEKLAQSLSKQEKEKVVLVKLSELPTREEYIAKIRAEYEARRKKMESAVKMARVAIKRGIATAYLTGMAKKLVKEYRRKLEKKAPIMTETIIPEKVQKVSGVTAPALMRNSSFNTTATNQTKNKRFKIDWFR